MKISVIVPVYRVERTLRRCVDSVLSQSWDDWEMILVDDGSPDSCPVMCDELAARDSRIKVIHKANAGLGAARNTGIKAADGDCVMFVDSDDRLSTDTLAHLASVMEGDAECDMAEFPVAYLTEEGRQTRRLHLARHSYSDMQDYFYNAKAYTHCYACNKIYRREVFDGVKFREDRLFEDVFTLPLILARCRKVTTIDRGTYYYYENTAGITATAGKRLSHLLEAHTAILSHARWSRPQGIGTRAFADYYAHVLNIQIDVYERSGADGIRLRRLTLWHTPKLLLLSAMSMTSFCRTIKFLHAICRKTR